MKQVSKGTQRWIDRAAGLALAHANVGEYNLGAIVVKGGSLLSFGTNKHRNDPYYIQDIPREHWSTCAEQAALHKLKPGTAKGATIYVARVTPGMNTRMARPCNRCADLIINAGISKVIYTSNDNAIVEERIRVFQQRTP